MSICRINQILVCHGKKPESTDSFFYSKLNDSSNNIRPAVVMFLLLVTFS